MGRHFLIFKSGGGRMGNQWLNMAHMLAFTLEYTPAFSLINLRFWYFAKYFSSKSSQRLYFFPKSSQWKWLTMVLDFLDVFPRVVFRHGSALLEKGLFRFQKEFKTATAVVLPPMAPPYLMDQGLVHQLAQSSVSLEGWGFRNWDLFEKHASEVRQLLYPNQTHVQKVKNELKPLRKEFDHLVGVFIRQTDYKTWKDGMFYFTLEEYLHWIEVYKKKYAPSSKTAFLIVSDEPDVVQKLHQIDPSIKVFHGHTLYYYLRNIIRLSLCDTILSPPSTFATLAAFVGEKTIFPLYKGNENLEEDQLITNSFFDARTHFMFKLAVN